MSKKSEYTTVGNATYHIPTVAAYKAFDEFKAAMDKEASFGGDNAHPTLHFAAWGDQRDAKLKEVYDAAVAKMPQAAPATTEPDGSKGKK